MSTLSSETRFGTLWLAANERGLCRLALPTIKEHARFHDWVERRGLHRSCGQTVLTLAKRELQEYLTGTRRYFTVPLDLHGSEFFCKVWGELRAIPYGQTLTYTVLATKAGRPQAPRAAGAACAFNPVPLIVPCHRAVGSNGSLRGFGGGLAMKEALLTMEGAMAAKGVA